MAKPTGIRLSETDIANVEAIMASGAAQGPTDAIRLGLALAACFCAVYPKPIIRKLVKFLAAA